mgnify:CR=1 FL=1
MSRATFIRGLIGLSVRDMHEPIISIVRRVALVTGISEGRIKSKERVHPVAHARQEVFAIARSKGYTLTQIAAFFAAHHTTISHGIAAHKARTNQGETA